MYSELASKASFVAISLLFLLSAHILPSGASQVESFYALPKEKFEKFCEIAKLVPESERILLPKNAARVVRVVSPEDRKTSEFVKTQDHYKAVWAYVHENGKQPYRLNWSGYVLYEVLEYLKETKGIDLMSRAICERHGGFVWWVFDKGLKDRYLSQLDPTNFNEDELRKSFLAAAKQKHELVMSQIAKRRDELLSQGKINKEQAKEAFYIEELMYKEIDFPERGKALMEAIKLIHQYLQMVDDNTVVILHIG